jgi:hypothetical protein
MVDLGVAAVGNTGDAADRTVRAGDGGDPVAGGEMVSQGSLEPLFQVRILARQPKRAMIGASRMIASPARISQEFETERE